MKHPFILCLLMLVGAVTAGAATRHELHDGRWFGTNYTVPFAHAYRTLDSLGIDRRKAIDRDVYHLSRLGLNAFRLHLWDVELTDSAGNLLENDHLDLLDYLMAQLEKRGIDILITAQTNFGNGYPERNTDPNGAFTYRYPKCGIHEIKEAQEAQARYLDRLVRHVNPYTGLSWARDTAIVGLEINNEPCHTGSVKEVEAYISKMVKTLRRAGWNKPLFYNVSHNPDVTEAYFRAPIDGATYQWYPLGLVAGHTRTGNFLPYVDSYDIPFDTLPGFDRPAKVIYEFDPADNLAGYLFPATVRTLRGKGFRWITQFAYDPIDMARFNTEYQTHYLNLAYTPSKAMAMMIAGEVMRRTPEGADYGRYPVDTVFGPFTVSARRNLAVMNTPDTFLYSNNTADIPIDASRLKMVAGVGSSPVVGYSGSGAYFLDRLDDTTWRLELMPDATVASDPFAKPSLRKEVVVIDTLPHPITVKLPGLSESYKATPVTFGNGYTVTAKDATFTASPGVYLLSDGPVCHTSSDTYGSGNRRLIGEYVMPPVTKPRPSIVHTPAALAYAGDSLTIDVTTIGPASSVTVYPSDVSFWNEHNRLYTLAETGAGRWTGKLSTREDASVASYRIVVGRPDGSITAYPGGYPASPLAWDYAPADDPSYTVSLTQAGKAIPLITATASMDGTTLATLPGIWQGTSYTFDSREPMERDLMTLRATADAGAERYVIGKYVGPTMRALRPDAATEICVAVAPGPEGVDSVEVSVVNADGFTYQATVPSPGRDGGIVTVPIATMKLAPTLLNPEPFPTFLSREFVPDPATATPLRLRDIDDLRIVVSKKPDEPLLFPLIGAWLR